MGREAWHAAIHGVIKSRTQLSDWTELDCDYRKNESNLVKLIFYHFGCIQCCIFFFSLHFKIIFKNMDLLTIKRKHKEVYISGFVIVILTTIVYDFLQIHIKFQTLSNYWETIIHSSALNFLCWSFYQFSSPVFFTKWSF